MQRFAWLFLCCAVAFVAASPSCLDESGEPVDWWVALKANNAADYFYIDSASKATQLVLSEFGMDGKKGAIVQTISQIYKKLPAKHGYALYNDNTDDGKTLSSRAHAKGVVLFDDKQGFWIIHSLPRFPSRRSFGYEGLPDIKYGQSFMCVTLPTSEFEDVGEQLLLMRPILYDSSISRTMESKLPSFASFTRDERVDYDDPSFVLSLKTKGGKKLTHFGKSKKFVDYNLYEDLVAPALGDIYVETWMNGDRNNRMDSVFRSSPRNSVIHVEQVVVNNEYYWENSQDHSKWVVTREKGTVCIGDINRQYSQAKRGGGTLCIADPRVWEAFSRLVRADPEDTEMKGNKASPPASSKLHFVVGVAVGAALVVAVAVWVAIRRRPQASDYIRFPAPQSVVPSAEPAQGAV